MWLSKINDWKLNLLECTISDHLPLFFENVISNKRGPSCFKFQHMWFNHVHLMGVTLNNLYAFGHLKVMNMFDFKLKR